MVGGKFVFRKENSLCSENTGAEQQSSYHAADLLFNFCIFTANKALNA